MGSYLAHNIEVSSHSKRKNEEFSPLRIKKVPRPSVAVRRRENF